MSYAPARWPRPSSLAVAALVAVGCASGAPQPRSTIAEVTPKATPARRAPSFEGNASWYGKEQQGHLTADGERFDMHALTAAHRTLPMNTRVRVTNLRNGRSVVVRINDRGPFGRGRVLDVSYAAARALDMIEAGVVPVRVEVVP